MHEENSEVSNFRSKFGAPRYFSFQHHLVGINVVEVGTLGQEEHSLFGEESFLLVEDSLLDNEVALDETVEVVVLGLVLQPVTIATIVEEGWPFYGLSWLLHSPKHKTIFLGL